MSNYGFLLSRSILPDKSTCNSVYSNNVAQNDYLLVNSTSNGSCRIAPKFEKAIIILIDALRYDFVVPYTTGDFQNTRDELAGNVPLYANALTTLYNRAVNQPLNALLLPFIAHPPTTTLQRLKALMTGSLPTFIEAGSNFAGTKIDEDNLIYQLNINAKRVVQLGDDTWQTLFPGSFDVNLTRPYDSFNVWDLHTVDNGVIEHLFPLLESSKLSSKWDVIIAHFLGVDHAGHRYGPDTIAMREKLTQLNRELDRLIPLVDESTLLIVMGDHGMDQKGDHGGESAEEVETSLWMYTKRPVFGGTNTSKNSPPKDQRERFVYQIDLVPTFALLMGIPIPFNNLGSPLEEVFYSNQADGEDELLRALRLTSQQMHRYIQRYIQVVGMDRESQTRLDHEWNLVSETWNSENQLPGSKLFDWRKANLAHRKYHSEILTVFQRMWTQFDLGAMISGIGVLVVSLLLEAKCLNGISGLKSGPLCVILLSGLSGACIGLLVGWLYGQASPVILSKVVRKVYLTAWISLGNLLGIVLRILEKGEYRLNLSTETIQFSLLPTFLSIGLFSNSFVVWEDHTIRFLLASVALFYFVRSLSLNDSISRKLGCLHSIEFALINRLTSTIRLCREEQLSQCRTTFYRTDSATVPFWSITLPLLSSLALPYVFQWYLRQRDWFSTPIQHWFNYALRFSLFLNCVYWCIDLLEFHAYISGYTLVLVKQGIAWCCILLGMSGGTWIMWTSKYYQGLRGERERARSQRLAANHSKFDHMMVCKTEEVTARGTFYFVYMLIWLVLINVVSKPLAIGALSLCIWQILSVCELVRITGSKSGGICLGLIGLQYFYATGHQAVFNSIQWDTAFIALKSMHYPISGLFIVFNTFSGPILCTLAVPLLALWASKNGNIEDRPCQNHGIGIEESTLENFIQLIIVYNLIGVSCAIAGYVLRRHLMFFAIFCPRYLFAVTMLICVDISVGVAAIGHCIVKRRARILNESSI